LLLQTKFKDSKVRIGSRKLYNSVETIKKFALSVNKDDMPEMDETAIVDANSKRIHLNMHFYRPFELETLSKLLAIKKNLKSIKVFDCSNKDDSAAK
jgi:enolase